MAVCVLTAAHAAAYGAATTAAAAADATSAGAGAAANAAASTVAATTAAGAGGALEPHTAGVHLGAMPDLALPQPLCILRLPAGPVEQSTPSRQQCHKASSVCAATR